MPGKKTLCVFVIMGVFVLAGAGWGVWRWQFRQTPPEEWGFAKTSPPEDYLVKETTTGKIVENKKAGLTFEVPEGWRVEKPSEARGNINLYSPTSIAKGALVMEKGCRITTAIMEINTDIETLKKEIEMGTFGPFLERMNSVQFQNKQGVRYTAQILKLNLHREEIMILANRKIYSLSLDAFIEDQENCSHSFDEFLETVSIEG